MDEEAPEEKVYEKIFRGQYYIRMKGRKCGHEWLALAPSGDGLVVKRYCSKCKCVRRVDIVRAGKKSTDGKRRCADPECGIKNGAILNQWNKDQYCGACQTRRRTLRLDAMKDTG